MSTGKTATESYPRIRTSLTPDHVAICVMVGLMAIVLVWNASAKLLWTPPLPLLLAIPLGLLCAAGCYRAWRPAEAKIIQILLYVALWLIFPIFGTQLTYLGAALAFPLRDHALASADAALGFRWDEWARFMLARPLLLKAELFAYRSYFYQPMLALPIFAFFGKTTDNAQLFLATFGTFVVAAAIHTVLPAIGPGEKFDVHAQWEPVIAALRAGHLTRLPYMGIVIFPSFHAAMAVLFTLAFRSVPRAAAAAAVLNLLMLLSIPFCGDHYLVDEIAGVAIALCVLIAISDVC